jgi:cell division protein FtsL
MTTSKSDARSRARRPFGAGEAAERTPGGGADGPQLQVVRRGSRKLIKRSRSRRLVPFALFGGILTLAVVFGVLLEQVVLAQSAFKLASVREEVVEAEARHQKLLLEAAELESSDRIEQFARKELGMVNPAPGQVQYLSADIYPRTTRGRVPGVRRGLTPAGTNAAGSSTTGSP